MAQVARRPVGTEFWRIRLLSRETRNFKDASRELTALDFYHLMPNEYFISLLTLTPKQLQAILKEQASVARRAFGLDEHHLPDKPMMVAFEVTGSDGKYPAFPGGHAWHRIIAAIS